MPLIVHILLLLFSSFFLGDCLFFSSALAALQHHGRGKHQENEKLRNKNHKEAEKLLQQSIAKDDLYYPAYLSLASLYIYRLKEPDKALKILEKARDRGPLPPVDALKLDAEALKVRGNEAMIHAGGSIFHEHEYLTSMPTEKNKWI